MMRVRRGRSSGLVSLSSSTEAAAASVRDSILMLGSAGGLAFRSAAMPTTNARDHVCDNSVRRGPLFSLHEELTMDEYYFDDPMLPEKKRRLSPEQVHLLEKSFEEENKLEPEKKSELAKKLGLQPRQVAVWYQNRRARWKTKQLERDFGRLKALYDALVADHDSLLADNQRLRSEVRSLTEQLQAKGTTTQVLSPRHDSPQQMEDAPRASEPSPSSATPTPATSLEMKADDRLMFTIDDNQPPPTASESAGLCFQEQDDGRLNGRCAYVVPSEEEDISDDGGGYFHTVLPDDGAFLHHHFHYNDDYNDPPLLHEEDVGGFMGWSVWS